MYLEVGYVAWLCGIALMLWSSIVSAWEARKPNRSYEERFYHWEWTLGYLLVAILVYRSRYWEIDLANLSLDKFEFTSDVAYYAYIAFVFLAAAYFLVLGCRDSHQPESAVRLSRRVLIPIFSVLGLSSAAAAFYYSYQGG